MEVLLLLLLLFISYIFPMCRVLIYAFNHLKFYKKLNSRPFIVAFIPVINIPYFSIECESNLCSSRLFFSNYKTELTNCLYFLPVLSLGLLFLI